MQVLCKPPPQMTYPSKKIPCGSGFCPPLSSRTSLPCHILRHFFHPRFVFGTLIWDQSWLGPYGWWVEADPPPHPRGWLQSDQHPFPFLFTPSLFQVVPIFLPHFYFAAKGIFPCPALWWCGRGGVRSPTRPFHASL